MGWACQALARRRARIVWAMAAAQPLQSAAVARTSGMSESPRGADWGGFDALPAENESLHNLDMWPAPHAKRSQSGWRLWALGAPMGAHPAGAAPRRTHTHTHPSGFLPITHGLARTGSGAPMLRCRGLGGQGEAPLVPLAAERRTARHALVPVPKEARLRVDRLWRGARGGSGWQTAEARWQRWGPARPRDALGPNADPTSRHFATRVSNDVGIERYRPTRTTQ